MLSADGATDGCGRMTRAELVQRLRDTAINMQDTSAHLEFFGGCSEAVLHAGELNGAAAIVESWADELEKEEA